MKGRKEVKMEEGKYGRKEKTEGRIEEGKDGRK